MKRSAVLRSLLSRGSESKAIGAYPFTASLTPQSEKARLLVGDSINGGKLS